MASSHEGIGPLARISHTLAGAGLVLAAPTGFRTLPIHPVLAAARKPVGTTMPYAIIPQPYEKCGLAAALGLFSLRRRRKRPLAGAASPARATCSPSRS